MFPGYYSEQFARANGCVNCSKPLTGEMLDSGYPPNRGQWVIKCNNCNMSTWFDLNNQKPF
jgi:hypothetical protein